MPKTLWYAGGNVNLKRFNISHRGIRKKDSQKYSYPINTDYVSGCCLFTSWEIIKILDGFDEQFNMYGEDVDLCLRAKEKKIQCYYWPKVEILHHVSWSFGGRWKFSKLLKKFISLIKLIKKFHYVR